jgi:hypothetical protein
MHDGCTGATGDGKMVVNKVRLMGFNKQPLPFPLEATCGGCGVAFQMTHFETTCPECEMVHGVTPCSAGDPSKVKAAGIGF